MLTVLFIIASILILAYHVVSLFFAKVDILGLEWYFARKVISYVLALIVLSLLFFTHDKVGIFIVIIYSLRWFLESIFNHLSYNEKKEFFEGQIKEDENEVEQKQEMLYVLIEEEEMKDFIIKGPTAIDKNGKKCYELEFYLNSEHEET